MARTIRHGNARDGKLPELPEVDNSAITSLDPTLNSRNNARSIPSRKVELVRRGTQVAFGISDCWTTKRENNRVRRAADRAAIAAELADLD